MENKKVFLTGITGQACSYLADLLVERNFDVHAMIRRGSTITTQRINHLLYPEEKVKTYYGDLADTNSIYRLLMKIRPDYIFNAGSMSHVRVSFDIPEYSFDVTGGGVIRMLEAIKNLREHGILKKDVRFLQYSSSEMFGLSPAPQSENTPMIPCSPYGVGKIAGFLLTKAYRLGYGMFAANAICFNMESERRGLTFVTQKIVYSAVRIKLGKQKKLQLGNLDAKRDWTHAKDTARGIIKVIEHDVPDDFVFASEEYHSVREFAERVFKKLNLDWHEYVEISDKYRRPVEVPELMGDASKAHKILDWKPEISFDQLIEEMISGAMEEEKNDKITTA